MERKTITLNLNVKRYLSELIWVLKARSKDDSRYILNYMNIDDTGFCCTDGRRLHFSSNKACLPTGLENGLYDVIIARDLVIFNPKDGDFPNYKQIIPDYKIEGIKIKMQPLNSEISVALARITVEILKGLNTINFDYLKDLGDYEWQVTGEESKAVKFVSGNLLAIIMPLKMK